ncbi:hypothetical protein V1Y59_23045 [Gordonia sp. PKS22-38]|uniref:Gram-positive cocci surface proteins LPxTG domain-containing protein n=1 Tax=Gordonia prachuapensis TaxID=3115651 RepID=A0ABU7N077_9ACTN|nr:hypothetical protein [Gordonia sp. PKS22-38]
MNTTLTTTRRIIIGAAIAAALAAPGAGVAFAESPAEDFQPGLGIGPITPPVGPEDEIVPLPEPDPEIDGFLPPAGEEEPGFDGPGGLLPPVDEPGGGWDGPDGFGSNPTDPEPPCEETGTCPTPCEEGEDECPPPCDDEVEECPKPDCEEEGDCTPPPPTTTTPPVTITEEKPAPVVITTDRPTFDTGDEKSVAQAALLGGAISLVIVGGTAVAVVRRPNR